MSSEAAADAPSAEEDASAKTSRITAMQQSLQLGNMLARGPVKKPADEPPVAKPAASIPSPTSSPVPEVIRMCFLILIIFFFFFFDRTFIQAINSSFSISIIHLPPPFFLFFFPRTIFILFYLKKQPKKTKRRPRRRRRKKRRRPRRSPRRAPSPCPPRA